MNNKTTLIFVLLCLAILGICCATSTRTPSQTVRKFFDHLELGDVDGLQNVLSKQFVTTLGSEISDRRNRLGLAQKVLIDSGGIRSVEILKEDILGDNAEVTDQIIFNNGAGYSTRYKLIKESGVWKIDQMSENPTAATSSVPPPVQNPTSTPSAPTSKVVMRFIWFGASFSAPIQKGNVLAYAGGQTFQKNTSSKGWVVLDGVPCNQNARIVFGTGGLISRNAGESALPVDGNTQHEVIRYVACSDKPVALGAFSWDDGVFISDDMDNIDACFTCQ